MTERTVSIARLSRKKMPLAALGASVLLLASCGTGEDSPAAQRDVEPRETATTTVTEGVADRGTDGGEVFAVAELINPEGEARGTAEFAEAGGGTLVTVDATDLTAVKPWTPTSPATGLGFVLDDMAVVEGETMPAAVLRHGSIVTANVPGEFTAPTGATAFIFE